MANYFSQWLRKRELKGLLRDIDRDYPELAVHQGENKIFHYLVVAVDDFTKAEQAYDQAPDKNALSELVLPPLLLRTIQYWTTYKAMTYSFMVIQQIIENTHLREQLAHHQQLQAWYASREKLVLEVTELTEKVIKTVNEAVSPTNRLN